MTCRSSGNGMPMQKEKSQRLKRISLVGNQLVEFNINTLVSVKIFSLLDKIIYTNN